MKKWFSRPKYTTLALASEKRELPPGIWTKCEECGEYLTQTQLEDNYMVCPKCDYHFRLTAQERLRMLVDEGSFVEHDQALESCDPLNFAGYEKKLAASREKTGLKDAILSGQAMIQGFTVMVAITDFNFIGGSMGSVVGERVARAMEQSLRRRLPFISVAAGGGGARMQEGALSLMQMAKTAAAAGRLREAGVPFISVFSNPTMGGVAASYASLGDVLLAEPRALIGFAGPRVIEQTIGQRLPNGFQTSEFLLQHGMIDRIVHRRELKRTIVTLLRFMTNTRLITEDSPAVQAMTHHVAAAGATPLLHVIHSRNPLDSRGAIL